MPSLGLGLSTTRGTSPGVFNVRNLANWFGLWYADESPLDGSGNPITDGTVVTLADLSGNGRDMTSFSAGVRPDIDSDGGPGSTPALAFIAESIRTAAFDTLTDFTIVLLTKQRSTGFGAGERIVEGDGTPAFTWQRNALTGGIGTNRVTATTPSSSGNFNITADEWVMVIAQCVQNNGQIQINDVPFAPFSNSTGAFQLDRFSIGMVTGGTASADQDMVMVGIIPGAITDAEASKIRTFAAERLGLSFSSETQFLDTFQRADTIDANIGTSDSGHTYNVAGLQAINTRILNNQLTNVDPWGTFYAYPRINFKIRRIRWKYAFRAGLGLPGGGYSTNAVGLSAVLTDSSDMVHIVWGPNQVRIERLWSGTTEVVGTVSFGSTYLTGEIIVELNPTAGTITVTGPDNTPTVLDWNAETTRDLIDYSTRNIFYEVISSLTNEAVCGYTEIEALP